MASRPVFVPNFEGKSFLKIDMVDFTYFSGFAVTQKQKSIESLHEMIKQKYGYKKILEVSSKSKDQLGIDLSAFNLMMQSKDGRKFSVECAFQSSKVFENGGPYKDLLNVSSREAKKDHRIKESGDIIRFEFYHTRWDTLPRTAFYDWLYINALNSNTKYHELLEKYEAFTDIEFNPEKSINCQAHAIAIFMSLKHRGMLNQIKNQASFLKLYNEFMNNNGKPTLDDKSQIKIDYYLDQ